MKTLFRVISQSDPVSITTQNGPMQKSVLVLQETGGKYEDSFVATLLGNQVTLTPGDLVWAALRFTTREYNGTIYQDAVIQDIQTIIHHSF